DEIIAGELHDQFVVDPVQGGAGTSTNMNANEVIANRALELLGKNKGEYDIIHPNIHVNMAQSTNDAFPTAIHVSTLKLITNLQKLQTAFIDKRKEFNHNKKMGRTHLQDAVPIRLGQEFEAYGEVLTRDLNRLEQARKSLLTINLGATAVGTGLNADPDYMKRSVEILADLTGLPIVSA